MNRILVLVPAEDRAGRAIKLAGLLQVVPGAHRAVLLEPSTSAVNPVLRALPQSGEANAVPSREAEGLAFSSLLVHGSGPNRGADPRDRVRPVSRIDSTGSATGPVASRCSAALTSPLRARR
jgi:hypothetical protein